MSHKIVLKKKKRVPLFFDHCHVFDEKSSSFKVPFPISRQYTEFGVISRLKLTLEVHIEVFVIPIFYKNVRSGSDALLFKLSTISFTLQSAFWSHFFFMDGCAKWRWIFGWCSLMVHSRIWRMGDTCESGTQAQNEQTTDTGYINVRV